MRLEVNKTKRNAGKLKGLKLIRNSSVYREEEAVEGAGNEKFLLFLLQFLLGKDPVFSQRKENWRFVKGLVETAGIALTLTRRIEVGQWLKKEKNIKSILDMGYPPMQWWEDVGVQTVVWNARVQRRIQSGLKLGEVKFFCFLPS